MREIKINKKYFKVLDLLGGEPEIIDDEVVCNELDLQDAATNLEIHIEDPGVYSNDAEVFAAIDELGIESYQMLELIRHFIKKM